jgi:hypothetical protein
MIRLLASLSLVSLVATSLPAHAVKTVYRCQDQGRTVYADEPCAKGRGRAIKVDDSKSIVRRKDEANNVKASSAQAMPTAGGGKRNAPKAMPPKPKKPMPKAHAKPAAKPVASRP